MRSTRKFKGDYTVRNSILIKKLFVVLKMKKRIGFRKYQTTKGKTKRKGIFNATLNLEHQIIAPGCEIKQQTKNRIFSKMQMSNLRISGTPPFPY